uniref:NADH-ubiquinone oxidoreductase chain 6 n=1 Tax=Jaminaea angkorensis TaxID=542766 RepID=V9N2U8_9BASI|nr:NADH dehydrogenase subunit 6 [Jaminaea angkorensis]AGJ71969.1 NADH dehydrogenase subunit 6 [Jaminaea angkorensis]
MQNILVDFLCLGAILSGILVITSKNPVISVLFLISVFVFVAGYLVLLGVGFIGISYLIVYVGAISILFLFVIMMLNIQLQELSEVGKTYTQNLPLGICIGLTFVYLFLTILSKNTAAGNDVYTFSWDSFNFMPNLLGFVNAWNSLLFNSQTNFAQEVAQTNVYMTFNSISPETNFQNFLQIQSIATTIYSNSMIWLMVCSMILLLAMIGPITLSMNKKATKTVA